jgi:hypothetical protein
MPERNHRASAGCSARVMVSMGRARTRPEPIGNGYEVLARTALRGGEARKHQTTKSKSLQCARLPADVIRGILRSNSRRAWISQEGECSQSVVDGHKDDILLRQACFVAQGRRISAPIERAPPRMKTTTGNLASELSCGSRHFRSPRSSLATSQALRA